MLQDGDKGVILQHDKQSFAVAPTTLCMFFVAAGALR